MTLEELFLTAGMPLDLQSLWPEDIRELLRDLTSGTMREARRRYPTQPGRQVAETYMGLHAHGFIVGRRHARLGLRMPGEELAALTDADLSGLIIPDDIKDL